MCGCLSSYPLSLSPSPSHSLSLSSHLKERYLAKRLFPDQSSMSMDNSYWVALSWLVRAQIRIFPSQNSRSKSPKPTL